MAESLAVRHRPRRFADVAGQRHISAVFRSAAARQDPPQQSLLAGGSGLGKTTLARIFAAALFCADRGADGDACGVCESCRDVTGPGGFHPDVIELDAASNGGKDEVRELAARAALAPLRAPWKVYIIDEAHGLTGPGGQAMLKLLEEPPAHVLFVLATTDPHKLPAAVRGRCSPHEVLPPTEAEVAANLTRIAALEGWDLGEEGAAAVVAATDPALGMRGTVMTLEKLAGPLAQGRPLTAEVLEELLGTVAPSRLAGLTAAVAAGDRGGALLALAELSGRTGASQLRRQLTAWARAELLAACRAGSGAEVAYHRFETLATAGTFEGALEVAVARMCAPELGDSAQAVRALLERAEDTLAALAAATGGTHSPAGEPGAAPPPTAGPRPVPAPASPVAPAAASPTGAAPAAPEAVPAGDPRFVQALNVVGRASARAAAVLRHCPAVADDQGLLLVSIPAELAGRAAAVGLPDLLDRLVDEGALPMLAAPAR